MVGSDRNKVYSTRMTRNVSILACASDRVKYIFNQSEADRNQEF